MPMSRNVLAEERIHPAIRERIAAHQSDIIKEVDAAARANSILVVGMKQNPVVKQARKALDTAGLKYAYLEYGSYLNTWRRRNALKMWTGWPTFPMIFVNAILVGGAKDLQALIASGELQRMLPAVVPAQAGTQ